MTAKIKLNSASGGGSISLQAPSSSSNNRVISLPDIADGTLVTSQSTLDATKLSGALPAISGANLTGISAGITMADTWIIDSNFGVGGGEAFITANWKRQSTGQAAVGVIGSAMTESSGVFTFPTTGMYLITTSFSGNNAGNYFGIKTRATTDNYSSSEFSICLSYNSTSNSSQYYEVTAQAIFDVTNVSTHKVKFRYESQASGTINGHSADKRSGVTFIRIGDT